MGDKLKKNAKMVGYLEKRGKMTFTGRWKRWWCVLERHLLLYYKSQRDYSKLSPCCGSLNVAFVRSIQPNMGCQIHIVTHSQRVILRTRTKEKQQQWFHALVSVLPQNDYKIPTPDNFSSVLVESDRKPQVPTKLKKEKPPNYNKSKNRNNEKCEAHDNSNITSVSEISHNSEDQLHISQENQITFTDPQNTKMFEQLKKLYARNRKMSLYSLKNDLKPNCGINSKIRSYSSYHDVNNLKSEAILKTNGRSLSCECIFKNFDTFSLDERFSKNDTADCKIITEANSRSKSPEDGIESNTSRKILRKRIKKTVVSKRTLSFFKKFLSKPKQKYSRKETDRMYVATQDQYEVNENDVNNSNTSVVEPENEKENEFTKPTNTRIVLNEDDTKIKNANNNVETEECQSWTMIRDSEFSNLTDSLPTLPTKEKINSPRYSLRKCEIILHNENHGILEAKPKVECNTELDVLLMQLTDLNNETIYYSSPDLDNVKEPDYDIPRSHASLIGKTIKEHTLSDNGGSEDESNDYLCSLKHDPSMSVDMAPDSLEMPWLSNNKTGNFNYWSSINDYHFCLEHNVESDNDDIYQDSLNPIKNVI